MDRTLAQIGTRQNNDKHVHMGELFGQGSKELTRQWRKPGGNRTAAVSSARYLGPHFHYQAGFTPEKERRIKAAHTAWYSFSGFWASEAPLRVRRTVFEAVFKGTLIDGLCEFAPTDRGIANLQATYLKKARVLLKGHACAKSNSPDEHHKSITNLEVMKQLKLSRSE